MLQLVSSMLEQCAHTSQLDSSQQHTACASCSVERLLITLDKIALPLWCNSVVHISKAAACLKEKSFFAFVSSDLLNALVTYVEAAATGTKSCEHPQHEHNTLHGCPACICSQLQEAHAQFNSHVRTFVTEMLSSCSHEETQKFIKQPVALQLATNALFCAVTQEECTQQSEHLEHFVCIGKSGVMVCAACTLKQADVRAGLVDSVTQYNARVLCNVQASVENADSVMHDLLKELQQSMSALSPQDDDQTRNLVNTFSSLAVATSAIADMSDINEIEANAALRAEIGKLGHSMMKHVPSDQLREQMASALEMLV